MTLVEGPSEERTAAVIGTPVGQTAVQQQVPAVVIATQPVVGGRVRRVSSSLAIESSLAWLAVIAGVVMALAALMMPRDARNSIVIEQV